MQQIENFVRNPVKVAVGVILICMFGLISIGRMPVQLIPEVQIPTLTIETRWVGASPQEIEREIIQEQEEQLQSVEGVTKMSSESSDSSGKITLEFAVGANLDSAITTVSSRLQQVREYPVDADKPVINTSNAADRPIAWFILTQRLPDLDAIQAARSAHPKLAADLDRIAATPNPGLALFRLRELVAKQPDLGALLPPPIDISKLRRYAEDTVEARFEKVNGVSGANVLGGQEDELQVIVDPEKLAARQITIADVRDALRDQNFDVSGGDFWEGKRRWVVRTLGRFRSPEQVAGAVILRSEDRPVYVRDVAEVRLGYKKPDGMVRRFGTSVIAINVLRRTGTNVLEVMDGLQIAVKELNEGALKSKQLQLAQVYDETEYIHSSINLVWENIWEGAALTLIVLLLFLRSARASIVVFLSIAVSIIGMFLMMSLMGRTLNVPSLAGIAFAVGMLVDNFIVVLENGFRHRQQGATPFQAAIRGTSEVWGAVVTSTLANLAVFIPVLFVQDEAGQLFRDIALATASALAISLLVALVVVPTAGARIFGATKPGNDHRPISENGHANPSSGNIRHVVHERLHRGLGLLDSFGSAFVHRVGAINAWLQGSVWRMVGATFVFVVLSIVLIFLLMPKVEYLPNGNRNLIIGLMLPPPGYNLEKMRDMGADIETKLRPYWDVDPDSEQAKALPFPPIGDFFYVARGRQLFLGLRAHDPARAAELVPLMYSLSGLEPGTMVLAFQSSLFEQGLTAGRSIDIEITGPEIEKLVGIGGQIFQRMGEVFPERAPDGSPLARAIPKPSLDLSSPEMHVIPKTEQAEDNGLRANEIGYAVNALVDGAYATDFYLDGDKIDLSIVGDEKFANKVEDLAKLPIATPEGGLTELSAVAKIDRSFGPEQINRRERTRNITVQVQPPPNVPLEEAVERIATQIVAPLRQSGQIGDGLYEINLAGTADKLRLAWNAMKWNLLLALIITYLVMAALFESWLYPFVIILSVPLGALGGFAGLQFLNLIGIPQSLDVLTMLGFIILVGTVVNNPILIVEQALNLIEEQKLPHRQAVVESVRTRIRPIFMTTLIGFFGLLPLVISPGAGSELYRGLGAVLLGGLLVSTVFTLFLVPSLFSLALETKSWLATTVGTWTGQIAISPSESAPAELPSGERHGHPADQDRRHAVTITAHSGSNGVETSPEKSNGDRGPHFEIIGAHARASTGGNDDPTGLASSRPADGRPANSGVPVDLDP